MSSPSPRKVAIWVYNCKLEMSCHGLRNAICDPMGAEGYVPVPQGPGMGCDISWDYVKAQRVAADRE